MAVKSDKSEVVKVCLIGDSSVGKSSISLRFAKDVFYPNMHPTLGVAYLSRAMKSESGKEYNFQVWDTAGQERYRSLVPMYYHGAAVILVVYDVTNRDSLIFGAVKWMEELQKVGPTDAFYALVANKSDKEEERVVSEEEGRRWATEMGIVYHEMSAKCGYNVVELFQSVCVSLDNRVIVDESKETETNTSNKKSAFQSLFNSKLSFKDRMENFKLCFTEESPCSNSCCSQKCETN